MTGPRRAQLFAGFAGRSMLVHTITYLVYGIAARTLFDYDALWREPPLADLYRPMDSPWVMAGPLLQPLRGLLFAVVLWPLRDSVIWHPRGWLMLWGLLAGLAVLGTPAAAPGSLEGLIYTQLPLRTHLVGLPELLAQTLTYAWLLHHWERSAAAGDARLREGVLLLGLKALSVALLALLGSALAGTLGARLAEVPVETLRTLPGSTALIAGVLLGNLALAAWLGRSRVDASNLRVGLAFYALDAGVPALFHLAVASPLPVWQTLLLGVLPAGLAWLGTQLLWPRRHGAVQWV